MDENKNDPSLDLVIRKLVGRLRMFGLGDVTAVRVIDFFGFDKVLDVISANPYSLMRVPGLSFKRADNIAQNTGVAKDDPRRQRALIMHILEEATNAGHSFLPARELEKKAKREKIQLTQSTIIEDLVKEDILFVDGKWPIEPFENCDIYLRIYYDAEESVADNLRERQLLSSSFSAVGVNENMKVETIIPQFEETKWDVDQQNFLDQFHQHNHNTVVLTGGPGTGKTTLTRAICTILEKNKLNFAICAPTGKAAKRCSELTGHPASTIHRFLRAIPGLGVWTYNRANKHTNYKYVIVDETSMLDIRLVFRLLEALPKETRLIFIGDMDQLQPIGPGSFFKDLIKSKTVPVFRLQTNHRQGKGSLIADNAIAINKGKLQFQFNNEDFFYVEAESAPVIREKLIHIIEILEKDLGYTDFVRDVQVLTPQKKTVIGTEKLNELLRYRINPLADPKDDFSPGDKVMQIHNNYDLKIFNGFVGQIINVTPQHYEINFFDFGDDNTIELKIDEMTDPDPEPGKSKLIRYPKRKKKSLMHAYACTVHKYQGSEVKVGIIVVSSVHTYMLTRNLLYTGITRCKEICVLVGDKMGLKRAIKNNREQERYSKLLEKLQEGKSGPFSLKR